jgi:hypothetical protein
MNIQFVWDPSVANAPAGFDVANYKADIQAAGTQLDSLLSQDNETLTVAVGLDEAGAIPLQPGDGGGGGATPGSGAWMSYSDTIQELKTHTTDPTNLAQLATLPATAPPYLSQLYTSNSQLKLWGKMDPGSVEVDGAIGFSSSLPYATPTDRAMPGHYDLVGMAFHEITGAILNRGGSAVMQLATYTAPGVLAPVNNPNAPGYFSLDGGVTNLGAFSGQDGGDLAKGGDGDPFNLITYPGIAETNITPADLALISWMGFKDAAPTKLPAPPPPPTPTPPPSAANFQVLDQTTGQTTVQPGTPYMGPTAGITNELIDITPHNLLIAGLTPNSFIHSGDGNDGINVSASGGNNTLDGEGGSNFLVGGKGNDTFFVNDLNATVPSWTTLEGFHAGDAARITPEHPLLSASTFAASMVNPSPTGSARKRRYPALPTSALSPCASLRSSPASTAVRLSASLRACSGLRAST